MRAGGGGFSTITSPSLGRFDSLTRSKMSALNTAHPELRKAEGGTRSLLSREPNQFVDYPVAVEERLFDLLPRPILHLKV